MRVVDFKSLIFLQLFLMCLSFIFQIYEINNSAFVVETFGYNVLTFSLLTIIFIVLELVVPVPSFLLSGFTLVVNLRLCSLIGFKMPVYLLILILLIKAIQFVFIAKSSIHQIYKLGFQNRDYHLYWLSIFIRILLGYDFIPYFCDSLFEGTMMRSKEINDFYNLGVRTATAIVITTGLIEFFCSLSFSCGFLTRIGSIVLTLHLAITTIIGLKYGYHFVWLKNSTSGWNYPILLSSIIFAFSLFQPSEFSIDKFLLRYSKTPKLLKKLITF
jgi:uncharacterized membrane protein YphA (DoxX/SURF4 family)